jgi:hypothetical protein
MGCDARRGLPTISGNGPRQNSITQLAEIIHWITVIQAPMPVGYISIDVIGLLQPTADRHFQNHANGDR